MSYMDDIPKYIQELSKGLLSDFDEIQTIIKTGRMFKKKIKIPDIKMLNCMIGLHLQGINKILFPEDINNSDSVDDVFLDVNLELLSKLITNEHCNELLSEEIHEDLESTVDCLKANFKERRNMLKLLPPNTHVEVVSSTYSLKIKNKSTSSRQIKKMKSSHRYMNNPYQWKLKEVVQKKPPNPDID